MKPGTVELRIERIVAGGLGLARGDDGVVLVRGALPGELVLARPALRSGALRAHAIEILEPHPARVDIALPPGADLPLRYPEQLEVKTELAREALSRIAKMEMPLEPIAPSPRELGYRTAAQYAVLPDGGLAARAIDSDRLIALGTDALVAEPIARAFATCAARTMHGVREVVFRASLREERVLAGLVGARSGPFERVARALVDAGIAGITWAEADARGRFRGKTRLLEGVDSLVEDLGGVRSTVTVSSFAQVNPLAAAQLYREAATLAGRGGRALELYSGSGALGLHLAHNFERIVAIDISADAIRRGEIDARRAKATSLEFHRGDARAARHFMPADVVVVDPPRAGLSSDVTALILEGLPPRVVYISCDPTTWARDVSSLCAGGYRLTFARPYDFYPYTHHVELLSVLER